MQENALIKFLADTWNMSIIFINCVLHSLKEKSLKSLFSVKLFFKEINEACEHNFQFHLSDVAVTWNRVKIKLEKLCKKN